MPGNDQDPGKLAHRSGRNEARAPSNEFLECLAREMALLGETYDLEITEMKFLIYQEALSDLSPELLRKAFARCRRESKNRPTPAEVREKYEVIAEETRYDNPRLPEAPPMSEAEMKEAWQGIEQVFDKIATTRPWEPPAPGPRVRPPEHVVVIDQAMEERRRRMKEALAAKYPATAPEAS